MYAHCRYYIIWSMNTICCFSLVKYFDLPKFDVFTWVVETLYKNRLNRLSWNAGSVFFFFEHPGTYYSFLSAFLHASDPIIWCISPWCSGGTQVHRPFLKKDGGFPKTRFPWCFWRKLPTNKSCPPMCSIEGFEIFEPWEVQQLWQGRRKVSGCIEIFCWLYHILATRNQLSHFWTKVGCRNAMSYTIFKNRVWWGLCFESFCSFLLNL